MVRCEPFPFLWSVDDGVILRAARRSGESPRFFPLFPLYVVGETPAGLSPKISTAVDNCFGQGGERARRTRSDVGPVPGDAGPQASVSVEAVGGGMQAG